MTCKCILVFEDLQTNKLPNFHCYLTCLTNKNMCMCTSMRQKRNHVYTFRWGKYIFVVEFKRYQRKYCLFTGLWFGKQKPHFQNFMQPFAEAMKDLFNKGMWDCTCTFSFTLLHIQLDNKWIYHMTRMDPHVTSSQNHMKKSPVWGPYAL